MANKPFYGSYTPSDYKPFSNRFNVTDCDYPSAKSLQPLLMQFKTGYRDMKKAEKTMNALKNTIKQIEN